MEILKDLRTKINGDFAVNFITLASGTSLAQIIPIIVAPLLTRIYSPHDFGVLALFTSLSSLIGIIATLQYESAIVLPNKDEDAISLIWLCLIIVTTISLSSLVIFICFGKKIAFLLGNKDIFDYLFYLPIMIMLTGTFSTLNYWAVRKKHFKRITIRTVSRTVSTTALKLVFGIAKYTRGGLISATVIGQFLATSMLTIITVKDRGLQRWFFDKKRILFNLKKYDEFPKYNAIQAFLDLLKINVIIFIINTKYGTNYLGYYSLTFSMVSLPLRIVGTSISQVFYQKAASAYNSNQDLMKLMKKLLSNIVLIALFFLLVVVIFAPQIFSLVFGSKWKIAGSYAQILAPLFAITFIASPFGNIPLILNSQKNFLKVTSMSTIVLPIFLYAISRLDISIDNLLVLYSISGSTFILISLIWVFHITKKRQKNGLQKVL